MAKVVVTQSGKPEVTRLLPRGNWMDESAPIVEPAVPEFLSKLTTLGRATRLNLANWIVSPDNPLTARVFVNRTWRQFFGTGLSKLLDDFGSQGEWPTHSELVDHLGAEFTKDWNVKRLIRSIVLRQAYRRPSLATSEQLERDPDNRLYTRQSRFRVEAESVRDIALAASGLLTERLGGPGIRPPKGPDQYRRGLYVHWQRTYLHPSLMTFDVPSREECTVNRTSFNTPLQALVLLNDPVFVEASRALAQTMFAAAPIFAARVESAYQRALNRPATPAELALLINLYLTSKTQLTPAHAAELLSVGSLTRHPSLTTYS